MDSDKKNTKPASVTTDISGLIKPIRKSNGSLTTIGLIIIVSVIVLGGVATGYALGVSKSGIQGITTNGTKTTNGKSSVGELEDGVKYDEAEGDMKLGGIDGEGTHHLERDGGPARYVYLTSSSVPLDEYIDKNVKVWGVTFSAQKAGWLMDVAKLEVR